MCHGVPMDSAEKEPISRLVALAERVDREFAAIRQRQQGWIECRAGCSDCCRARLSITRVEEAFLRRHLAALSELERAELARRAGDETREMCPALDPAGHCQVYEARPLICRSFGVPLRRRREVSLVNPPLVDVCDKNFVGTSLKVLPDEDVFEQTSLEAEVSEIDAVYCERNGLPRGERVPIAQILRSS
jgi:Fe-S-cluster containining protein